MEENSLYIQEGSPYTITANRSKPEQTELFIIVGGFFHAKLFMPFKTAKQNILPDTNIY